MKCSQSSVRYVPPQSKAAQDVLCDLGHQRGVLRIVIQRIAGGEPFDHKPGSFIERGSDRLIAAAERALEGAGQVWPSSSASSVVMFSMDGSSGRNAGCAKLRRRLPVRNWRD